MGFSPRSKSSSTFVVLAADSPCPATVKLDIDGLNDTTKVNPGGLVIRSFDNNGAARKKIILRKLDPPGASNKVILTRSSERIDVYTAASGGTKLKFDGTDNKFADADLPKELWVGGVTGSTTMRDQKLTLALEDRPDCKDEVFFTAVWVVVTTKHAGAVSNDNSAKAMYESTRVPPTAGLGYNLAVFGIPTWTGAAAQAANSRGSEFIGAVEPSDFVPTQFQATTHLAREVLNGKFWLGPNGNEQSVPAPAGDDTSDPAWRDDDPQSGGSGGKIYDLDGPQTNALTVNEQQHLNWILRLRVNFNEWAECNGVRCSVKKPWFTRQSYKFVGPAGEGVATGATANTIQDNNKSWATDFWVPGVIRILSGTGIDQYVRVIGNTATTITIATNWLVQPDTTSQYRVIKKTSWQVITQFAGDNQNGDGATPISWNLQ